MMLHHMLRASVSAVVSYLLRTAFDLATSQPVTLVDGITYTDADGANPVDWMVDGSIEIDLATAPSTATITGDKLALRTGAASTSSRGNTNTASLETGRLFVVKNIVGQAHTNTNTYLAVNLRATSILVTMTRVYRLGGTDLYAYYNPNTFRYIGDVDLTDDLSHVFAIDKGNNKILTYYRVGDTGGWTLGDIATPSLSSETAAYLQLSNGAGGAGTDTTGTIGSAYIPETLQPTLVTASYTLTDETAQNTFSDVVLEGSHTAVTGQTLQVDYRGDGTFDNCWRVKVAQGSSNNCTLHKVTAGVESAALSTGSATINNATSYRVQIHHQDANYAKVYVDSVEVCTYTTTDTHQQTATNTRLQLGTILTVSIDVYQRDGVTINV